MRLLPLATGNFYHVFNRGVDRRTIFMDTRDYQRFYLSLYLFNNEKFSNLGGNSSLSDETVLRLLEAEERRPFVNILSYCLMPNHFHLLFEQMLDDGIQKFMHRVSMGFAHYFNKRHERTGRLFEGTYKSVGVHRDAQLQHLPRYMHLNALDLTPLKWRDGRVEDWDKAQKFLDNYPWSSHGVYSGRQQALPVVEKSRIEDLLPSTKNYTAYLRDWSERYALLQPFAS